MEDYGNFIAPTYDKGHPALPKGAPEISFLAKLAGRGPALELGIGTGRIALPLAQRGVAIEGVDVSTLMVEELRRKPSGKRIPVHMCSMADLDLRKRFRLIFSAFNTFYSLTTYEEQAMCFARVARHLLPSGTFVLETFYPDLKRFQNESNVRTAELSRDHAVIDLSRLDPAEQRITSVRLTFRNGRFSMLPPQIRFAWPKELDQMAKKAGLRPKGRWNGWKGERFTAGTQGLYVSAWELARTDS